MSYGQELRSEASAMVDAVAILVGPYKGVGLEQVESLLGVDRTTRLLADPIRRLGPNTETVYSWNVVDYLANEASQ